MWVVQKAVAWKPDVQVAIAGNMPVSWTSEKNDNLHQV